MIKCPNCGTMNEAGSRFCFQCGQTLSSDSPAENGERTQPINPPSFPRSPQFPGQSGPVSGFPPPQQPQGVPQGMPQGGSPFPPGEGYQQPGYGPGSGFPPPGGYPPGTLPGYMMPPEPPRRRRWLWIILGILLGCIVICAALGIWGATAGEETFERWGTQISEFSTEEAEP